MGRSKGGEKGGKERDGGGDLEVGSNTRLSEETPKYNHTQP